MTLLPLLLGCWEPLPPPIEPGEEPTAPVAVEPPPPPSGAGSAALPQDDAPAAALHLTTPGDRIAFDVQQLTAPAGRIRLTFTNAAQAPAMQHNVAVVTHGAAEAVGIAAIEAGPEHLPDHPDLLAATALLNPGESASVLFALPAGEYDYLCTFPGHYISMTGALTVTTPQSPALPP